MALPAARELTVEANPETVTPELAHELRGAGVNRVSLGAQTFQTDLLRVLERHATPVDVELALGHLRDAGFDNLSLDLIYGIPGQTRAELADDLERAIALGPEHISAYELEAKHGTRFTIAHGAELERQAEQMEDYFERVVATLTGAGYRWYETANFCRDGKRAEHNLGYWLGHDYLGLGIGAVSTHPRNEKTGLMRELMTHCLRLMSEEGGINIVMDPEIKGRVSIKVVKVPWDQIFEAVLTNNGLDKQVDSTVVFSINLQYHTECIKCGFTQSQEDLQSKVAGKKQPLEQLLRFKRRQQD